MKAIIKSINIVDVFNVNFTVIIYNDDDTILFEGSRGFTSSSDDKNEIEQQIQMTITNIAIQMKREQNCKLQETIQEMVGKEIIL